MFKRITRSAATLLAGMLAALVVAGAAAAAPPVPFSLVDRVDFAPGGDFTFTSTIPGCASGTFVDDIKVEAFARSERARSGGGNVLILTTLTCDDGGTFMMRKHIQLTFTANGFTTAGPFQIFGGTGAYKGITGHGVTTGEVVGETGGGTFTGVVKLP